MNTKHIAVIDIGKTNAKLALVDLDDLSEIAVATRPNIVLPGPPWPHFDVDGHWDFLLDALKNFHALKFMEYIILQMVEIVRFQYAKVKPWLVLLFLI